MVENRARKVMCIVAHPDDEALGVGGTLIRHVHAGDQVECIILSEGEDAKADLNKRDPERRNKATMWAHRAGCVVRAFYDFPDQRFDTIPMVDIVAAIQPEIDSFCPDIIYTHHPWDLNHDHRITCQAVLVAIRPMRFEGSLPNVYAFETPSSTDQAPNVDPFIFQPNHYVVLDDVMEDKMDALEVYANELGEAPHPRSRESIRALATKRGAECGAFSAEAFVLVRSIWS